MRRGELGRCRVVPDVGTAESPAKRDRRYIHTTRRNKRCGEPGSYCLKVWWSERVEGALGKVDSSIAGKMGR